MKAGQFTDAQIVAVLQEAAKGDKPIIELCREKGISEATFYSDVLRVAQEVRRPATARRAAPQGPGKGERPA